MFWTLFLFVGVTSKIMVMGQSIGEEFLSINSDPFPPRPSPPIGQKQVFIEPYTPAESIQTIYYGDAPGHRPGGHGDKDNSDKPNESQKKPANGEFLKKKRVIMFLVEFLGSAIIPLMVFPAFLIGLGYLLLQEYLGSRYKDGPDSKPLLTFDGGNTFGKGEHSQVLGYDYPTFEKRLGLAKKTEELTDKILPHI